MIPPSYVGTMINHYKDLFKGNQFFMGSNGSLLFFWKLVAHLNLKVDEVTPQLSLSLLCFRMFQVKIHPISHNNHEIHPPKLTCPLKNNSGWKTSLFLRNSPFFGGHSFVFGGCNYCVFCLKGGCEWTRCPWMTLENCNARSQKRLGRVWAPQDGRVYGWMDVKDPTFKKKGYCGYIYSLFYNIYVVYLDHLKVNWWFGLVVWIPRIP